MVNDQCDNSLTCCKIPNWQHIYFVKHAHTSVLVKYAHIFTLYSGRKLFLTYSFWSVSGHMIARPCVYYQTNPGRRFLCMWTHHRCPAREKVSQNGLKSFRLTGIKKNSSIGKEHWNLWNAISHINLQSVRDSFNRIATKKVCDM